MFKFLINDTIGYVRANVREFSLNAIRLLPQLPQLSPYDVNMVLKENEFVCNFNPDSIIHSYETNQLGSNTPCEDSRTEASLVFRNGFICGIFDGHGGAACGQVVSKRLLRYISAATLPRQVLQAQLKQGANSESFLKCHNDKVDFVSEIKPIYEKSFLQYVQRLCNEPQRDVAAELQHAFIELDENIAQEAIAHQDVRTMGVALSGAVACLVHLEGRQLHVASTGDCGAVLGTLDPKTNQWSPKKLNIEHNADNMQEVNRILAEHPKEEQETIIRNGRLLSQLAPLRAFGDYRYKWSIETLKEKVGPMFGEHIMPPNYYTPPYLTARPDVQHHELDVNDKFLVIASDGLWDFLSPSEVVSLVGEHINSKKVQEPMRLPIDEDVLLQQISEQLAERKAGRNRKSIDQNAATHLIRNALGSTEYGIEHSKLSYYLTLPKDVVRLYRDDITITVLFFNTERVAQVKQEEEEGSISKTPAA